MTREGWKARQRRLNAWTSKHLKGVTPLRVDGDPGAATRKRIVNVKYWLGYRKPDSRWDPQFHKRLISTFNPRLSPAAMIARGVARRQTHNRAWQKSHNTGVKTTGVTVYDGRTVAAWFVPYLNWARYVGHNGVRWSGRLVSGFRTPAYSEHLCYAMCGAPRCPGRCAGRFTHHSQYIKPAGAVDVTDYIRFGWLMQFCPYLPHIFNVLPNDRVHFSATGN
jgi:hypothetical protein